jgi:hypothetical protein
MELFRLLGTIAIDNTEANTALNNTADTASDTANETEEAFRKIGTVAGTIATGIGVAGLAIGGALIGAVESTREYRKEMGLLEAAYLTAGHSSEAAKNTYSDLNAVMGDSGAAVEAAQHLALIADNEKELNELTHSLTGVYARYGASLPLESLAEGINHTAKLGEVQGSFADALEWAGLNVDDFNVQLEKCANEEERQKLIMDTLNTTYSESATQYKETNKEVTEAEKAQERLTDAIAEVGAVCEPIMTRIKDAIAGMAEHIAPFLADVITQFKDIVKWVQDNEETVKIWSAVILGATTTIGTFLLILNWGAIMSAASGAINTVKTAILGMNTAMLANPIGLIVALIAGLVVAFIYLWNNCEGFRKFWIDLWAIIKDAASVAWEWIKKTFSQIGEWFSTKFEEVQTAGKNAMDKVKKWFSDAWKSIKDTFSGWGDFFGGLWTKIKEKFSSIGSSLGSTMSDAVKTGINAVLSTVEGAINKGIRLINGAIELANKLPAVNVGFVKEIALPRLAKGTVVTKATKALIGEDGAEAVVPLERNTQWIDKVALQFKDRMNNVDNSAIKELSQDIKAIISLLQMLIQRKIYLDSDVLVGELAPLIDEELGNIESRRIRGI